MKKADVQCGARYVVKVSGKLATVQITGASPFGGWVGLNVETGRTVRIRSAARLRRLASAASKAESRLPCPEDDGLPLPHSGRPLPMELMPIGARRGLL